MTCSFSFGKIITLIYSDCDHLNNKLYFVVIKGLELGGWSRGVGFGRLESGGWSRGVGVGGRGGWSRGGGVGGVGVGGLESGGWSREVGVGGVELMGLGSGGGIEELGSEVVLGLKAPLKVLQLIYKYLVVSCAVFNYLVVAMKVPCSSL